MSDNGEGISEADRPRLFDRFSRGARAAGQPGGLRLGLAIARWLTELHGGSIRLDDDPPEGGACFAVSLPLAREQVASEEEE